MDTTGPEGGSTRRLEATLGVLLGPKLAWDAVCISRSKSRTLGGPGPGKGMRRVGEQVCGRPASARLLPIIESPSLAPIATRESGRMSQPFLDQQDARN